jgi:hypothetical protein
MARTGSGSCGLVDFVSSGAEVSDSVITELEKQIKIRRMFLEVH